MQEFGWLAICCITNVVTSRDTNPYLRLRSLKQRFWLSSLSLSHRNLEYCLCKPCCRP